MAFLVLGKSTCPICENVIDKTDEIFVTKSFLPKGHKFWKYSDTTFHLNCYKTWAYYIEFDKLYTEIEKFGERLNDLKKGISFEEWQNLSETKIIQQEMGNLIQKST